MVAKPAKTKLFDCIRSAPVHEHHPIARDDKTGPIASLPAMKQDRFRGRPDDPQHGNEV